MLDGFPQRDFVLWVLCTLLILFYFCFYSVSLLLYIPATTPRATTPHLYRTGYHAFTTTAWLPRLSLSRPPRLLCSIPGLSHLSYHAPPHTYIGSSHPPLIVVCSLPFTGYYATCSSPPTPPPGRHTYEPTPHGHWTKQQ